jgi:hypothetical protein
MTSGSKKVRSLFRDAERIAEYLLELRAEEERLRGLLERLWRTRAVAMGTLAARAAEASQSEAAEFTARQKKKAR